MVGKFTRLANSINLFLLVNNQQMVENAIKNKIKDSEKVKGVENE